MVRKMRKKIEKLLRKVKYYGEIGRKIEKNKELAFINFCFYDILVLIR